MCIQYVLCKHNIKLNIKTVKLNLRTVVSNGLVVVVKQSFSDTVNSEPGNSPGLLVGNPGLFILNMIQN